MIKSLFMKKYFNMDEDSGVRFYVENNYYRQDKWTLAIGNDITRLAEKPGVYVVYSKGELVYIGQSNCPRFRMTQHLSAARTKGLESPWGDVDDLLVKVKYPSKYGREAMIEKRLIRRLKPRLNGYGKFNKRPYRQS